MKKARGQEKVLGILETFTKAEKLKSVLRCAYTSEGKRKESSADHSWMLALLAIIFFHEIKAKIDRLKALKMVVIHDLAEAIAGDSYPWELKKRVNKHDREEKALKKIVSKLPQKSAHEILSLWHEYEDMKTPESQFAHALDKMEVLLQHNVVDTKTWLQGDFDCNPYWKDEYFDFDPFLRVFKDQVDLNTMKKIIKAGKLSRIKLNHIERFKKSRK